MSSRNRMIAVAGVVTLMIVLVVVFARQPAEQNAEQQWLPGLRADLAKLQRVHIQSSNGGVTLLRQNTGWGIAERDNYPADFRRFEAMLSTLAAARRIEQKTAKPEFFDRLGLVDIEKPDSKALLLELSKGATKADYRVIIGNEAEGRKGRYVRAAGENQSWLIDQSPQPMAGATDWLDKTLLAIDYDRVARVTRTLGGTVAFAISRNDATQPNLRLAELPAGKRLKYDGVFDAAGRGILNAQLDDVSARAKIEFPEAAVQRTLIECFDGLSLTVDAIKRDDGGWIIVHAAYVAPVQPDAAATTDTALAKVPAANEPGAAKPADATPADAAKPRDVQAETTELAHRFDPWAFKVSDYVYGELSKGLNDYLEDDKPAAASGDAAKQP